MKNHAIKTILPSLLGCVILASMLAGCGGDAGKSSISGNASTSTASGSTSNINAAGEPAVLSVAFANSPNIEDMDTNWFTRYLEEKFNVDLQFTLLPTDATEAKTKITLMISSGETLPDVINEGLDKMAINEYGSKGVFTDLTPYFSDPQKTPKFNAIPQDTRDFINAVNQSPKGAVYAFPAYMPYDWNEATNRAWINLDWLKIVDQEVPTTTDELYTLLMAFAETDCNGNGKKDEVAMVGGTGWGQNPIPFLMNAFLYANPDRSYFDTKDGKIIASFTQPEWKQGLEYLEKLVREGLLSPLSFTQDGTQLKSLVNVEKGMAGIIPAGSYSTFDTKVLGSPSTGNGYQLLGPVKGPEGKAFVPRNPTTPGVWWYVTKDCRNVDLAVAIGDNFLDRDTHKMLQYGEPEVDWSNDPEITKDYLMSQAETDAGYSLEFVQMTKLWGVPQNKSWQQKGPFYSIIPENTANSSIRKDSPQAQTGSYVANPDFSKLYAPLFRPLEELIVTFNYSDEEATVLADIKTVIDTYVQSQTVAFVTGKRPLSDWDNYLAELEKMGLPKYLEINQASFDRFGK